MGHDRNPDKPSRRAHILSRRHLPRGALAGLPQKRVEQALSVIHRFEQVKKVSELTALFT